MQVTYFVSKRFHIGKCMLAETFKILKLLDHFLKFSKFGSRNTLLILYDIIFSSNLNVRRFFRFMRTASYITSVKNN